MFLDSWVIQIDGPYTQILTKIISDRVLRVDKTIKIVFFLDNKFHRVRGHYENLNLNTLTFREKHELLIFQLIFDDFAPNCWKITFAAIITPIVLSILDINYFFLLVFGYYSQVVWKLRIFIFIKTTKHK